MTGLKACKRVQLELAIWLATCGMHSLQKKLVNSLSKVATGRGSCIMQRLRTMQALLRCTHVHEHEDTQQSINKQLGVPVNTRDWHHSPQTQGMAHVSKEMSGTRTCRKYLSSSWRTALSMPSSRFGVSPQNCMPNISLSGFIRVSFVGVNVTITEDTCQLQHCPAGCFCEAACALLVQKHQKLGLRTLQAAPSTGKPSQV